jgi:hypothetical protein
MITIKISGGLGNQLFQWALGRSISECRQRPVRYVCYDISSFNDDPQRCYLLDRLGLKLSLHGATGKVIMEQGLRYQPEILQFDNANDYVLHGYWQCEKYFSAIQDVIRSEVFHGMEISAASHRIASEIQRRTSAFLHVRRTDNTHPAHTAVHGLLGLDYYGRAAQILRARVPDVHFFIFSDEPEWAKEHMRDLDMTVVDCNPVSGTLKPDGELQKGTIGRENEDLWLMSLCQHGIVANSTFSWWGAWLNPAEKNGKRVVIAPQQDGWFQTGMTRLDSTDIIPDRWSRI